MKKTILNYLLILIFGGLCLFGVYVVITYNTNGIIYELAKYNNRDITMAAQDDYMIGFGDDGIRTTPISASVDNGYLTLKANINNETGYALKLRDFAIVSFGGNQFPAQVNFEGNGKIENNSKLEVEYRVNIKVLKKATVLPTTLYVDLGTYDSSENYKEYNVEYVISWHTYE